MNDAPITATEIRWRLAVQPPAYYHDPAVDKWLEEVTEIIRQRLLPLIIPPLVEIALTPHKSPVGAPPSCEFPSEASCPMHGAIVLGERQGRGPESN